MMDGYWFARERQPYFAPTLANGTIGITPSIEPMQIQHVVQNGAYDIYGRGQGVTNILKAINFATTDVEVNGEKLSKAKFSDILHWRQFLNMKTATLKTIFDYKGLYQLEYSQLALRHLPHTFVTEIKITALNNLEDIRVSNLMDSSESAEIQKSDFETIQEIHLYSSQAKSPTGRHVLAATNAIILGEKYGDTAVMAQIINEESLGFKASIPKGKCIMFTLISSVTSSAEFTDPVSEAKRFTLFAYLEGKDKIINRHQKEWAKLWESDIIIEGDMQVQTDVRFALFNLYSSIRANSGQSIGPMGTFRKRIQWAYFLGFRNFYVYSFTAAAARNGQIHA